MSSNSTNKPIIQQTPPNLSGQSRVDLRKNDFDAAVWQKGYDVYLDKALRCPCRNSHDHQALSSCKNCGGSGWVYLNRYKTKMVLQAMNLDTKFKEWSEERIGTVRITALTKDELSFMDRITLIEARSIVNDVVYPEDYYGELRARVNYQIHEIDEIFMFESNGTLLKRLSEGVDYDILQNSQGDPTNILRIDQQYANKENLTISIRYQHSPQFHILDVTRSIMNSQQVDKSSGQDITKQFPISAMGRRSHYVLDEQNYNKDFLLDNSHASSLSECLVGNPDRPNIPQDFRIDHPTNSSVNLYWEDVPTEDSYIVQRKEAGGAWVQIALLGQDVVTYNDATVMPSGTYYYRIAAREGSAQSEWSEEIGITTNP